MIEGRAKADILHVVLEIFAADQGVRLDEIITALLAHMAYLVGLTRM